MTEECEKIAYPEHDKKPAKKKKEMAPKKPDVVRKQKRAMKVLDDPGMQVKLKKKVATKRAKKDIEKVTKAGGDDTRPLRASKKAKTTGSEPVPDKSAKTKSVRSRNS